MQISSLLKKGMISVLAAAMMISATSCSGSGSSSTASSSATESSTTESSSTTGGKKEELTFTSWANTGEIAVLSKAVDAYNAMQDNVKITFQNAPGEGYEQKLITALAGGAAADVFYAGDSAISKLIKNGTVAEMTEFLKTGDSFCKAEDFADGLWGAARTADGKIYGLTVDCNPLLLYYSPKQFAEFGIKDPQESFKEGKWDWNEFDSILKTLVEKGKKGFIMEGDAASYYRWIFANGGKIYDGDTYKFDDKAKQGLEYVVNHIKDGTFTYGGSLPKGQGADASFLSGQVGFVTAGRWYTPTFHESKVDFDYIPYPKAPGMTEDYVPIQIATAYMSVNKKSKNVEEALKFASYYCSTEGQKVRLGGIGNAIPSIGGIDNIVSDSKVPVNVDHIFKVRDTGWALGSPIAKDAIFPGLADELKSQLEEIVVNGKSVDEMLPKIEKKANEIIAESKK